MKETVIIVTIVVVIFGGAIGIAFFAEKTRPQIVRCGFNVGEEVLVNEKYKGFVEPTPIGYKSSVIRVQWIDGIGNSHHEAIDYHFVSHIKDSKQNFIP